MESTSGNMQINEDGKTPSNIGCPIPPMSAYDIFIHMERKARAGSSSGMFETEASFASHVSAKWNNISADLRFELEELAKLEQERYNREMKEWKLSMKVPEPETPKIASGNISYPKNVPVKKRMSLRKKSGTAFPPLPFKVASGPRRVMGRNAQSSLLLAEGQSETS